MQMNKRIFMLLVSMILTSLVTQQAFGKEWVAKEATEELEELVYEIQVGQKVEDIENKRPLQMLRIEFFLDEKTVVVQYGGGEYYVIGRNDYDGQLAVLNDDDYEHISETLSKVDIGDEVLQNSKPLFEVVYNALNLLNAWPKKMPVFIWQDKKFHMAGVIGNRIVRMNKANIRFRSFSDLKMHDLKELDQNYLTPPEIESSMTMDTAGEAKTDNIFGSWNTMCSLLGQSAMGKYIRKGTWSGYKYNSFQREVGGGSCFGRCGIGCLNDGNKYTQDCFNHDGCVNALGILNWKCNIMFTWCIDDYLLAPEC